MPEHCQYEAPLSYISAQYRAMLSTENSVIINFLRFLRNLDKRNRENSSQWCYHCNFAIEIIGFARNCIECFVKTNSRESRTV